MAFPSSYTKYQEVTIDNTKVSADLTDFVVYIDLSDLVKAGADIFDTCRTDGGDIRVTKSDGTTELAREIVAIDTSAKTGEVHVKFSGTLSSSTDTVIRIWYNGTDVEPAVTATYGRNNVWTGYEAVWHMQEDPSGSSPQLVDSTGNSFDMISTGTMTSGDVVDGKLAGGKSISFDGTDDGFNSDSAVPAVPINTAFSLMAWIKGSAADLPAHIQTNWKGGGGEVYGIQTGNSDEPYLVVRNSSNTAYSAIGSNDIADGTWHLMIGGRASGGTLYVQDDNNTRVSGDNITDALEPGDTGSIGKYYGSNANRWSGAIDEVRMGLFEPTQSFNDTLYENQNSPSTFYSAGDEEGGFTTVSPSAQVLTSSIPSASASGAASISVGVQALSLTLPDEVVTGNIQISPDAQVATFTLPAPVVQATGVAVLPSAQTALFTLPVADILGSAEVSAGGQMMVVTVPASSVSAGWQVGVDPAVLTVTVPTLEFVGALWGRTARTTTGADWTRSAVNNDA